MCHYSDGLSQILTQIPTWIIVIVGWFVVHHLSTQRDQRKEARERLDQFISALRAIEEKAIQFHQSDSYKGDVARALLFDIQRIIAKLKRHPFGSFVVSPDLQKELRRVRIPVQTGHTFHGKLDSHSRANWTLIPRQIGQ